MAIDICFYFQVHQPWRLRHYRYLEVGKNHHYFNDELNARIIRRVADQCYLPMNALLFELISELRGDFRVSFSISATAVQQMEAYAPDVIASFKRLFDTGYVELLSETSHHSLAALYSVEEFKSQVALHREIMSRHFIPPSLVLRNTELIMSNQIAQYAAEMGYKGILMEGADHILRWRSPLFKYRMHGVPNVVALMKNYRLSDDIAFRFSDKGWAQWPLTSEKFAHWVKMIEVENPVAARGGTPFLGLFMDYETFGEHQWASTGIFDFMRALPKRLLDMGNAHFIMPTQAVESDASGSFEVDAPEPFSWADVERDLSAWRGNPIQDAALRAAYQIEPHVRQVARQMEAEDASEFIETWRRLLTSDHYYYMCTKYFADGDVHKYFNPYDSPYDAHIIFMNVMADMAQRCGIREKSIA